MLKIVILFWNFFKIGLFTFGGGYAMIPMIEEVALTQQWISSSADLYAWLGIAEGTPGPFAVNIATFIGYQNAGFFGSLAATLGVILPSWIIIVLIAAFGSKILNTKIFKNALMGLRPVIITLIFSVTFNLFYQNVFGTKFKITKISIIHFDWISLLITLIILPLSLIKIKKKKLSPIFLILIAGCLGILFYGCFR